MAAVVLATREDVQDAMEMVSTPRADKLTDRAIGAATDIVQGMLRRRFYPETKTIRFDWPGHQHAPTWTLYLEDNEFISVAQVVSGGVTLDPSSYFLRRTDDKDEPPYDMLQIDLSSAGAFSTGTTFQRSLAVTGDAGYNRTNTSVASGSLSVGINDSASQIVLAPVNTVLGVGVGSIAVIGSERLLVTGRYMVSTGVVQSDIDDDMAAAIIDVTDGTAYAVGEVILLGSERMHIDDIAGNNLLVTRAWDGTALATHEQADTIYARRGYYVTRGALGTSAASHSQSASVYVHDVPPLVNQLCIGEASVLLEQNASAYALQSGAEADARKSAGTGLNDIRQQARIAYGRGRLDAV